MKKALIACLLFIGLVSCSNQDAANKPDREGYRQCMSDKRQSKSKVLATYIEACGNSGEGVYACVNNRPRVVDRMFTIGADPDFDNNIQCKRENNIT